MDFNPKAALKLITKTLNFNVNTTVHVFESTIRIIGGLLSAYQLNNYKPKKLLKLASNLGDKILPAFEASGTTLPYPRIDMIDQTLIQPPENYYPETRLETPFRANITRPGIPPGAIGGMLIELTTLSRLTGDARYETAIRKAINTLYKYRSTKGLLGSEINVETLTWSNTMSGIGAGLDSIYECLLKNYIAYGNQQDLAIYKSLKMSVDKYLKPQPVKQIFKLEASSLTNMIKNFVTSKGKSSSQFSKPKCFPYVNVDMFHGNQHNYWIDSLSAFYPGMLVLDGDHLDEAICLHAHYWTIFNAFMATPERYNFQLKDSELKWYPLRPEFTESTYYLYKATRNPFYLHVGKFVLDTLVKRCKVDCGFATIHNVNLVGSDNLEDRQESFFLSETLKYLYLLFDEDNFLNQRSDYVFTTEAHVIYVNNTEFREDAQLSQSHPSKINKAWKFNNYGSKFSQNLIRNMNSNNTFSCASPQRDYSNLNQQYFLDLLNFDVLPDRVVTL